MFPIWINDGTNKMPEDDIFYIISNEGIFLKKKLGLFESIAKVDKISILNKINCRANMDIPKLPSKIVGKMVNFFKYVYYKYQTESALILHYNPNKKVYKIEVPIQEVSFGSVTYASNHQIKDYIRIGTAHSHASMNAFHSNIDIHDEENWDGIHFTFGNLNQSNFTIACSIVANGTRFIVDPENYLNGLFINNDIQKTYQLNLISEKYNSNITWFKKVKKYQYPTASVNKYNSTNRQQNQFNSNLFKPNFDNPCEDCPFKEYKIDLLLDDYINDTI